MDWLTWLPMFPAFYWQRLTIAVGLLITFWAMLMAVRRRSRAARRKPI
jgi:hypothetical protein